MLELLDDAARTVMRAFQAELRRAVPGRIIAVPVTWLDDTDEGAAVILVDLALASRHVRAGGCIDRFARRMWNEARGDAAPTGAPLRCTLHPDFVVGAVPVHVLSVAPLVQAAAGGLSQ